MVEFEVVQSSGEKILKHLSQTLGVALDYDQASVEWLNGYIERNRHVFSEEKRYGWALAFGYILGEAIRRAYGGKWEFNEQFQEWTVNVGEPVGKANPIGKAYKHLETPAIDSIAGFFDIIGRVKQAGGWDALGEPPSAQT